MLYVAVLVGLYEEPEKPNDALDFIKQHMGAGGPETADVESLKLEVTDLRKKLSDATEENAELKARVSNFVFTRMLVRVEKFIKSGKYLTFCAIFIIIKYLSNVFVVGFLNMSVIVVIIMFMGISMT